jgi:hypothetical protein
MTDQVMDLGRRGIRSLAVARTNEEGKWQMLGILTFLDPPRPDTKDTIEKAMEYGVDVKMITGGWWASSTGWGKQQWVGKQLGRQREGSRVDAWGMRVLFHCV